MSAPWEANQSNKEAAKKKRMEFSKRYERKSITGHESFQLSKPETIMNNLQYSERSESANGLSNLASEMLSAALLAREFLALTLCS